MLFELVDEDLGYDGVVILHGITISIAPGERVALVGENGAGKSTLLSVLQARYGADTAYIPQDPCLVESLSVFHNIYMGSLRRHPTRHNLLNLIWPQKKEIEAMRPIAERLGLGDRLFERAGTLSGGQQQRAAICRAIVHGGAAVLGDEPVSAADAYQARATLEALNETFETVILSMHDVDLALRYSTRIVGVKDGGIALDRPAAGLARADLNFLYER